MSARATDLYEEIHRDLDLWLARLAQVDRLLAKSVPTYIDIARWALDQGWTSAPLYISDRGLPPKRHYLLVQALYTSTIHRLCDSQRRFDWLEKHAATLESLSQQMPEQLMADDDADRTSLDFLQYAANDLFGALNPVTSSEVFWAFIRAGERYAHSGVGFLTFFGILWSLSRRYPDEIEAGAALEPSGPSTSTTARCLNTIHALCYALRRRGQLYRRAAALLRRIEPLAGATGPRANWRFTFELDILASTLFELSTYTIIKKEFVDAGEDLLGITRRLRADSDTVGPWTEARARIAQLLRDLAVGQKKLFADAGAVVDGVIPKIIARLEPGGAHHELRKWCHKLQDGDEAYWADHARAATRAHTLSAESLAKLEKPFDQFDALSSSRTPTTPVFDSLFSALAASNLEVAEDVDRFVAESVRWCRRAINEESARASAGNVTDFDPAGLVSAIAVVQKWDQISRPEAEDAIRRALEGAQRDGSWSRGQPIFLQDRVLGVWPHTPDIVWMLAVALNAQTAITVADEKIFAFVEWLERTMTQFILPGYGMSVHGWSSELDRVTNIIDCWNTSVSINALLEIRTLIENRLWDLCTRRFTILPSTRILSEVAPVDLGAVHEKRLHRRLMKMARWTELQEKYKKEIYGIVLHGPPGSSKTAIVEGLGAEMWKGLRSEPRIIRITPADFIRQGEARIDFEARFIFDLISHVRGVTILFDEIDDFLRQRLTGEELRFLKLVVPAMLNRLQDLRDAAPRQEICFVINTNFIDKIEPALLRPGRIDAVIPVTYPDVWSREAILESNLGETTLTRAQTDDLLRETVGWPWSTFNKLTKEIGRKGTSLTDEELRVELDLSRDNVQSSDYYYYDAARWQRPCAAFASEFIHLAFSASKEMPRCRMEVDRLVDWFDENNVRSEQHRLVEMFDRQSKTEGREK